MKIHRTVIDRLLAWKDRANRLPLVFKGVRQVGKTETISHLGNTYFDSFLKVDLERDSRAAAVFRESKDPNEIISKLEILTDRKLSRTGLLFIDEIHACPPALTSLKYFAEDLPQQAVIAAGSHLGILLAGILAQESYSFPVGKVEFLELSPVTFAEFVNYCGAKEALETVSNDVLKGNHPVSKPLHDVLWDLWKEYLIVGGLPRVITDYAEAKADSLLSAFKAVRTRQQELITAYEADIAKHSGKVNAHHIIRVLQAIPHRLSTSSQEHTQRFTFKDVVPGLRGYDRLAGTIDWLTSSGLAVRIPLVKMPLAPLKGFADEHLFKLFFFDVGLFGALAGISPKFVYDFNFGMYKGVFAESFVLQELRAFNHQRPIVCWATKDAEVEFILEQQGAIVPIEVKSSQKFQSRSLASFEKRFAPPRSYILSANRGSVKGMRRELPIYCARLLADEVSAVGSS